MCLQSGTECRKLLVRLQSSEVFCGFLHGRRGPAQGHRGRSPSLHVAADATHGAHDILHDVGACERAAKFLWQAESCDGEDLIEALQNARRHAWSVVFQPAREIADQLLGLLGVVQLPSLSQHAANSGMQRLRQPLQDVASLVDLAPVEPAPRARKLRRIAFESAFEPSMMNNRGTAGSRPRAMRLSISACTTAAFSVAPLLSPSGCFTPLPSMPIAATSTSSPVMWMPSISAQPAGRAWTGPRPSTPACGRPRALAGALWWTSLDLKSIRCMGGSSRIMIQGS